LPEVVFAEHNEYPISICWLLAKIRPFHICENIRDTKSGKIPSDTKQNPSKIEVSGKNKNLGLSPRFQVAGKIKQIGGESSS